MRPAPRSARLLAAVALAVALGCLAGGAGATVATTCRAAADSDARVDYGFCVAELGKNGDNPDADAWGLAKVAALRGVNNADNAVNDAEALIAEGTQGPRREALEQCVKLYGSVRLAFAEAGDDVNSRRYAAAKGKVAEAVPFAHQCDDALAKAYDIPYSPLPQSGSYTVQIAIVCTAVTNLIK